MSPPAPKKTPAPLARTPFVLLGLLTIATLGGPLAILLALRGGARTVWPPDRPLEWWTFGIVIAAFLGLLAGCLGVGLALEADALGPGNRAMIAGLDVVAAGLGAALIGLAFILSAVLCALTRRWAPRWGLIDHPGGHKGHQTPTPLGGGVAIWLTTITILSAGALAVRLAGNSLPPSVARHVAGLWFRAGELGLILALASLVMVMGLIDDRFGLPWQLRLGVQGLLATTLVVWGVRVTLFWPFTHAAAGGALSVFWIVALTNAFNMLDNMDGLAASVGLIAALLFAAAQLVVGSLFVPAVLLVLVGALAGFLVHNRVPARLFMGDAGSNFIGFLLGALTIAGTYYPSRPGYSPYGVLAPLLVMAVPLYDMTSVVAIRLLAGRSPFQGDRCHFSHRLVERGLTPKQAVRTIDLVTLAGGLGALLLHRLSAAGACVVVAQTGCLLGVVALLELSRTRAGSAHAEAKNIPDTPLSPSN